jgi:hypothetical protein
MGGPQPMETQNPRQYEGNGDVSTEKFVESRGAASSDQSEQF